MSKPLDLVGQRFGILTAIERAPSVNGRTMWRCKCDCGTEVVRQTNSLLQSKETGSCGCLRKKKDLTGEIFGDLTVLRFDGYFKKNPKWVCKCSCGEEISVFENGLKNGNTKNCGGIQHSKFVGMKFGRLTVCQDYIPGTHNLSRKYLCKCDCGQYTYVTLSNLKSGNTRSCGCLERELNKQRIAQNTIKFQKLNANSKLKKEKSDNLIIKTHGMSNSRIYGIWNKMRSRCNNKNDNKYYRYGARGITVCEEWNDFCNFYEWAISHGYLDTLSINRIDNDGNYCPENCNWATDKEQANNKSTNDFIEYNGEVKTLAQWACEYNVSPQTVRKRYKILGWSFDKALNTPTGLKKRVLIGEIEINGEKHTIPEWALIRKLDPKLIYLRLHRGWSQYDAIMRPSRYANKEG